MTKLATTIRNTAKKGNLVSGVVIDTSGTVASVRISGNGAIYKRLSVIGGPVSAGQIVSVDLSTQTPIIVASGLSPTVGGTTSLTVVGGSSGGGGVSTHGILLGLSADDHLQYVAKDIARSITAQHTFAPGSAQAPFILSANAQGQTVTGLKADQLNKQVISGNGLTGGGYLTADLTLAVGAGNGISVAADSVAVNLGYGFVWTAQHQFAPGSAQAPFTLGANALGQLVTGLNADKVDGIDITAVSGMVPRFTSATALGAGVIQDNGTIVSIGVAPIASNKLTVKAEAATDIVLHLGAHASQSASIFEAFSASGVRSTWMDKSGFLYSSYIVAGITGATTASSATYITDKYVQSRGMNLVTNGSGLMGNNYNFVDAEFVFDTVERYSGGGSFKGTGQSAACYGTEKIPVDVGKYYKGSLWAKSTTYIAGNHAYFGCTAVDIDGNGIAPYHFMQYNYPNTQTTLAVELKPGDTTITLTSAAGWQNAGGASAFQRNIIIYDYVDGGGYAWPPNTYSRNGSWKDTITYGYNGTWDEGAISGNVITLRVPWTASSGTHAAGTSVANASAGASAKYFMAFNVIVPNVWTNYTGVIGGLDTTLSNTNNTFPYGTAYITLFINVNRDVVGNVTNISNVWCSELTANNIEVASSTQQGVVALANQQMGTGDKYFVGKVGVGTTSLTAQLHSLATTEQLRLQYDATRYASFTVDASGNLLIVPAPTTGSIRLGYDSSNYASLSTSSGGNFTIAPTGDLYLNPVGKDVLPTTGYDINIGILSKKFLQLHVAELWAETLVAQNTLATIGGRILVGETTILTSDLAPADVTLLSKYNNLAVNDIVYLEANGSVEFMQVTSGPTGVGPYSYGITRNLDGTGANQWYAGDAVFNTGIAGDGFIDLYSQQAMKGVAQSGPSIVGNVRSSTTFNDWVEHWAIGNLKGLYGYGSTTWGVGLGKYATDTEYMTIDPTNGLRIYGDNVLRTQLLSGVLYLGDQANEHLSMSGTALQFKDGINVYAELTAGALTLGKNAVDTEYITIDPTNGLRIYGDGVLLTQLLSGTFYFGNQANEHLYISSTALQFKDGAVVYTELSSGILTLGYGGSKQVSVSNTAILFRDNADVYTELSGGVLTLGLVTGGEYATISATGISLKTNAIERIGITNAGILTIKDSAGAAVFTLDAAAGAEFTKPLTVGAAGGIYQGTGTFASPTTGLKIWNDSGIGRIGGYSGGTLQWYADSGGTLKAGNGAVTLGSSGITVTGGPADYNAIKWYEGGSEVGHIHGELVSGHTWIYLYSRALAADKTAAVKLWVENLAGDRDTQIELFSSKTGFEGSIKFLVPRTALGFYSSFHIQNEILRLGNCDLRIIDEGLYVGGDVDPAVGTITATNWIKAAGDTISNGLFIGTDTQLYRDTANNLRTPGSLVVDGDIGTAGSTYYNSSTLVGWSSTTTSFIWYKLVGKLCYIWFTIEGTSNSTATSFTLPYSCVNFTDLVYSVIRVTNNDVPAFGLMRIDGGTNVVNCYPTAAINNNWVSSGYKSIRGHFAYRTA